MKKVIPVMAVLITLAIIISCSKTNDSDPVGNYVCHCLITTGGTTHPVDQPYNNVTKSYATTTCATQQDTYNSGGTVATCTLQ